MRSCSAQSGALLGRTGRAHRALARARQAQPVSRARAVRQGNVMCFLKPVQQSAEELQERGERLSITFSPLHDKFGVEVVGADLTRALSGEEKALLQDAFWHYDMLLFRGRPLSPKNEVDFLTMFPHDTDAVAAGRHCNGIMANRVPGYPLLAVRGKSTVPVQWHQDKVDVACVPEVDAMYMLRVPPRGGETLFASASAAAEALPPGRLAQLEALDCEHRSDSLFTADEGGHRIDGAGVWRVDDMEAAVRRADADPVDTKFGPPSILLQAILPLRIPIPGQEVAGRRLRQVHPLLIRDPRTSRRSLLYFPAFFYRFVGHSREESRAIVEDLLLSATAPENVFTMRWRPHDFVVWNNRMLLHSNTDHSMFDYPDREMHLVFLDSNVPVVAARAS